MFLLSCDELLILLLYCCGVGVMAGVFVFVVSASLIAFVRSQTGYVYQLDSEYSGANFFNGWDFFTVS